MCAAPSPRVEEPISRKRCDARSSIFWRCGQKKRIIPTSSSDKPFQYVALPESLFHLAALNRGLKLSPLPQHLADLLITPKSIGASRE